MDYLHSELTEKIIRAAYNVHNTLGFGFLERVYENALVLELKKMGLKVEQQKTLTVWYDEVVIGEFFADILVEGKVIVEIKAVKQLVDAHDIQILNYVKGSKLEIGVLLNFSESVQVRRKYFSHQNNQRNQVQER